MENRINEALSQAAGAYSQKVDDIDASKLAHKTSEEVIKEGQNALKPIIGGDAATLAGLGAKYAYSKYMKPKVNTAVDKAKSILKPKSNADTDLTRVNRGVSAREAESRPNGTPRGRQIQVEDDDQFAGRLQASRDRLANLRLGDAQRAQGRGRATLGDEAPSRDVVEPRDTAPENPYSYSAFEGRTTGTPGQRLGEIFRQGDEAVSQPSTGLGDVRQSARAGDVSARVATEERAGASLRGGRQLPLRQGAADDNAEVLRNYQRTGLPGNEPPSAHGIRSGARTSSRVGEQRGAGAAAEEGAEEGTEGALAGVEAGEAAIPGIGDIMAGLTAIGGLIGTAVAGGDQKKAADEVAKQATPHMEYMSAPQQDTSDMAVGGGLAS
jgi:hypothetical protein